MTSPAHARSTGGAHLKVSAGRRALCWVGMVASAPVVRPLALLSTRGRHVHRRFSRRAARRQVFARHHVLVSVGLVLGLGTFCSLVSGTVGTPSPTACVNLASADCAPETSTSNGPSVADQPSVAPTGGLGPSGCTAAGNPDGCADTPSVTLRASAPVGPVSSAPELTLVVANPTPPVFTVGSPAPYSFTVTNHGSANAASASISDVLPEQVQFMSALGATCVVRGGSAASGQIVACTVPGPIKPDGGVVIFTMTVTPQAAAIGTSLVNRSTVDRTGGSNPPGPAGCVLVSLAPACAVTSPITVAASAPASGAAATVTPLMTSENSLADTGARLDASQVGAALGLILIGGLILLAIRDRRRTR